MVFFLVVGFGAADGRLEGAEKRTVTPTSGYLFQLLHAGTSVLCFTVTGDTAPRR